MTLRYIFIFCLCVFFHQSKAQTPYRCLIPGDTSFFINQSNYLRAITIDSVTTAGNDTVYHPFRSLRGQYDQFQILDSNGGSWLGKTVIAKNDGTWLFDTYWGDTAVIKTRGNLGDNWTFLDDTSTHSYKATIYATDTFSFSGVLDSIKKIRITAYNNGVINPNDSLDGLELWLSKKHGFAKVFNLYLLPFWKSTPSNYRQDLYADITGENPWLNGQANTSFTSVTYIRPSDARIYDIHPGDIFQYINMPTNNDYNTLSSDTIVSVTNTSAGLQIQISSMIYYYPHTGYPDHISYWQGTYSRQYYDQFTNYLPEHNNPWTITYYPSKYFNGYTNKSYQFNAIPLLLESNGYKVNTFEPCDNLNIIHGLSGIGDLYIGGCVGTSVPGEAWKTYMTYARKNGQSYGTPSTLAVTALKQINAEFNIYPNPANNEIHFTLPAGTSKARCSLNDITGRVMLQQEITASQNIIDVHSLASGIYILSLSNGAETTYQKIEIVH